MGFDLGELEQDEDEEDDVKVEYFDEEEEFNFD